MTTQCQQPQNATAESCEGFDGPCASQRAEKRAAMTAYHWDGTGEDPNRPPQLCDECWQGYKAHWTEMWAEAGLSPMINAGPAMQLQEAFDRTFVSDYVRCRACDEKRIASGSQEHLCVPHNRPQDLLCPCGGIREAYDCQDETWITEGPRNGDTDARVIPDVAALFDRTNGGSR